KPVDNSLIGGGCVITDASISYSVLFDRIKINEGSQIDHSVVLSQVEIGKNCVLIHCIIDRHCIIPDDMHIGVDKELDRQCFRVSSSGKVVLVTPSMLKKLEGREVVDEEHLD
ncbi:glucose-1-phosphate adenylyltransferase, partial [Aggregatibacter actinomycetemcomitans]